MAQLVPIALASSSNRTRYGHEGAARLINTYVEQIGEEGKQPWVIYGCDPVSTFGVMTNGDDIRAMLPVGSSLYVVAGRNVYAVDGSGTGQLLGSLATDGFVTMAANRRQPNPQIAIVWGGLYYLITNNNLSLVSDADLPPPLMVFERDGYFIFPILDGRVFFSGINDGANIDGLDFFSAESRSDQNVMGATRGSDNIIFGRQSMEFWTNVGDADSVFARQQSLNIGCYAAGSVAEITAVINGATVDSNIWAATDEQGAPIGVFLLNGYAGQKISNPQVDRDVQNEPFPQNIRAYSWSDKGHVFYEISGTSWTHCYDTVTGTWHDGQSYGLERRRFSSYARFAGKHIFGDYDTNRLYAKNEAGSGEAGEPLVCTIQTPPVHATPYKVQHHELHIDVTVNDNAPWGTENPVLMVDWSDDGGFNWSTQRLLDVGRQGNRTRRIVTRRLGTARSRTYRISWNDVRIKGVGNAQISMDQLTA